MVCALKKLHCWIYEKFKMTSLSNVTGHMRFALQLDYAAAHPLGQQSKNCNFWTFHGCFQALDMYIYIYIYIPYCWEG